MSVELSNFNTADKHSIEQAEGSTASYWKYREGCSITLLSNALIGTVDVYNDADEIISAEVPIEISLPNIIHNAVTENLGYNPA